MREQEIDRLFAGLAKAAADRSAALAAHRQKIRNARNARRRARYAATPRPAPSVLRRSVAADDDWTDDEPGCRCSSVRMPPCSWCENGRGNDSE